MEVGTYQLKGYSITKRTGGHRFSEKGESENSVRTHTISFLAKKMGKRRYDKMHKEGAVCAMQFAKEGIGGRQTKKKRGGGSNFGGGSSILYVFNGIALMKQCDDVVNPPAFL